MRVSVFSTKPYDRDFLERANQGGLHELAFLDFRLHQATAIAATGSEAVCAFVNDDLNADVLGELKRLGIRFVALRAAGFNNVDLAAAKKLGVTIARVPEYSPHAVAEHAVALMLALNRNIHRAFVRVREGNFALDGLLGFDFKGRSVGVVGTGKIGVIVARIMVAFGCQVLAYDPAPNQACELLGARYVGLPDLLSQSDVVSLHCPLTPQTYHLIGGPALEKMRDGVMLINTSRGAVIDARAAVVALKSGRIGSLGLDVYEEEADLFFENLSDKIIQDDVFARLLTFPNVLITAHQAFFTSDALTMIAETTIGNLTAFAETGKALHEISTERLA